MQQKVYDWKVRLINISLINFITSNIIFNSPNILVPRLISIFFKKKWTTNQYSANCAYKMHISVIWSAGQNN